ncbi:hypothetical protein I6E61_05615 [Psychrobacter sp. NZS113]|uniref:hypothetical protein n=1 Tax=Psychrobacter sp. NZS113 TaxID=2792045 RepID=UPI0018CDA637|nr:hypothetical protein [Psychrobacter sp. NZS113]MBH0095863.1 hypothetical protein [Psychrobacter sp. NZS113]
MTFKLKKIVFITSIILLNFYILVKSNITGSFIVTNHTETPISIKNFQYEITGFEPTAEEMEGFESRDVIQPEESIDLKTYKMNWFKSRVYMGISFFYRSDVVTDYELNSLKGVSFSSITKPSNKKPYCKFQIEVYPNNKTIVTPLERGLCLKYFDYNAN